MEKYTTDPRTGLDYELVGDYYLIAGDDGPAPQPLGLWGRRRLAYLKDHRQSLYYTLLLSGKLEEHLHTIDANATDMADRLTAQLSRAEGLTEANGMGPAHEQHPGTGEGDREREDNF